MFFLQQLDLLLHVPPDVLDCGRSGVDPRRGFLRGRSQMRERSHILVKQHSHGEAVHLISGMIGMTLGVRRESLKAIETQASQVTLDRVGGRRRNEDIILENASEIGDSLGGVVHGRIVYSPRSAASSRLTATSSE